ncbi:cupin domain-containing protein [Kinneretia aquatilis]|uniref:cupin domain-containing protein n=1 Tax=Kinneretia aquatilis TaxID=2070761 RepID=UPI001CBC8D1D|nr:cupin domain-containing protein [Paucibacter aquatile]WIV97903.1 cupin domain-containing protein [Paucibacter aquatile]
MDIISHFTHKASDTMSSVNLSAVLSSVSEPWQPTTVARFNGNEVMVAKALGSYAWHKHESTDDLFFVLKGIITIEMRDRSVRLGPGEMFVVPRGVEHRPVATEEAHFILIEPPGTANDGTTLV